MLDVYIIGGGASGMFAAIKAAKNGHNVTILEKNFRLGKKILVTGNGRCNLGNTSDITNITYNNSFAKDIIIRSREEMQNILVESGLMVYSDNEGRIYPLSDSANTVLDCLRFHCYSYGINILTDIFITGLEYKNNKIRIISKNNEFIADKVILAIGGKAQNSEYNLLSLIDSIFVTSLYPALTYIVTEPLLKSISGIRLKCVSKLLKNNKLIYTEKGEVQFKDNGIGGICIMNISSLVNRDHDNIKSYEISLDLMPQYMESDIEILLLNRKKTLGTNYMTGIFHNKIGEILIKLSNSDMHALAHIIKDFRFKIKGMGDFNHCQVMSGGIKISEPNDNLRLKHIDNLYACGEVIDVDGLCGGYNLQWAFCSGIIAGELK